MTLTDVRIAIAEDHTAPRLEYTAAKVEANGDTRVTTYPLTPDDQQVLRSGLQGTLTGARLRVWIEGSAYRWVHDTLKVDQEGIAVFDLRP